MADARGRDAAGRWAPAAPETAAPIRLLLVDAGDTEGDTHAAALDSDEELAVSRCATGAEAVSRIVHTLVDVVVLAVRAPAIDGFGVIARVGVERMPVTVMLADTPADAVRAFEASALDRLVRPFTTDRLRAGISRAKRAVQQRRLERVAGQLAGVLAQVGTLHTPERRGLVPDRLVVQAGTSSYVVDWQDVDRIEAADNYARLWTKARSHLVRESLERLEASLAGCGFIRTHRTALVRVDRIREIRQVGHRRHVAVLLDGSRVPVSRQRKAEILSRLRDRRPESSY